MIRLGWKFYLGVTLIVLSVLSYGIHYLIFHDAHHIFLYLLGDIAFVFIEVLLVTLIIHRVLDVREKKCRLEKLNMVIGAFFNETGSPLLAELAPNDPAMKEAQSRIAEADSDHKIAEIVTALSGKKVPLKLDRNAFKTIKKGLLEQKHFILRLLENQNLLEHEAFTDTLWAVCHLLEELNLREDIDSIPDTDLQHLTGDATRAYRELCADWIEYMKHLKTSYPYLYSLAVRINPFDSNSSPIVNT